MASKYGMSAASYLASVQEMLRAGFDNAEGMAELSLLAQAAGGMAPNAAEDYLTAADRAYRLGGSISSDMASFASDMPKVTAELKENHFVKACEAPSIWVLKRAASLLMPSSACGKMNGKLKQWFMEPSQPSPAAGKT